METTIRVNDKAETAIIDNYVNKEWCEQNGIDYQTTGYGKIRAYDGSTVQELIRKATIEFEVQGTKGRQTFHVFKETGQDNIVLGMPWLVEENPAINWKNERDDHSRRKSEDVEHSTGE